MSILLIEDDCAKACEIVNALQAAGRTCEWITGLVQTGEHTTAILPSGGAALVRLRDYKAVLVGDFLVGQLSVWSIAPSLLRCGILCIGISDASPSAVAAISAMISTERGGRS